MDSGRLAMIGTRELRNLINGAVAKARYCQTNAMSEKARQHAADAVLYAAEIDRRA